MARHYDYNKLYRLFTPISDIPRKNDDKRFMIFQNRSDEKLLFFIT